ncbi:MAG TPA: DUF190 domain-containing protein [Gammaproteobacteria bacterium]
MSVTEILVVRVYLTERKAHLDRLVTHLRDVEQVRGLTVFRAVAGFGPSGHVHAAHLVELAADLPLVVEFFDTPARARAALAQIRTWLPPGPVISWAAALEQEPASDA